MTVEVNLISNCDDAIIFWRIKKRIPNCWGFAIEREKKVKDQVQRITLDNRKGFKHDNPQSGDHRPSTVWPFQRFWWADHSADLGDVVRYRVCPIVHAADQTLSQLVSKCSDWTPWTELSGGKKGGYSSFFNRGLVISQFMARYLKDLQLREGLPDRKAALVSFMKRIDEHEEPIRLFLSGTLRTRMLEMLADANKAKQHVFAALYELEDEELIEALGKFGARGHVVLANGSIQANKGEPAAEARKRDQNKAGRKALKDANVEVLGRFVSPGALGHNKFLVVADKADKPELGTAARAAWTGSTNWTATGLCTQINNGLFVADKAVAAEYLKQWARLRDAKSEFPKTLVDANSKPKPVGPAKTGAQIWFTRTAKKVDLAALDDVLNKAKKGILFLMFQPGGTATLGTVRKIQAKNKSLYIKGVVSTLPSADDESSVTVDLHTGGAKKPSLDLDVVQPQGIKTPFASWAATVTRNEFLKLQGGVVGFAIVHSKLIVVDPFTDPVVVTGSHNFSGSASTSNDENFIIVRGNDELARQYAAHILSVYQHYSWLAFVNSLQGKGKSPDGFLKEIDTWQDPYLKGPAKREQDFWMK